MWAEMFFSAIGSEVPDFQVITSLAIIEINMVHLIIYINLALTSEITVQIFQHLGALEAEFFAIEGIPLLAR